MVGPLILGIACAAASEPQLCHYVSHQLVDAAQAWLTYVIKLFKRSLLRLRYPKKYHYEGQYI